MGSEQRQPRNRMLPTQMADQAHAHEATDWHTPSTADLHKREKNGSGPTRKMEAAPRVRGRGRGLKAIEKPLQHQRSKEGSRHDQRRVLFEPEGGAEPSTTRPSDSTMRTKRKTQQPAPTNPMLGKKRQKRKREEAQKHNNAKPTSPCARVCDRSRGPQTIQGKLEAQDAENRNKNTMRLTETNGTQTALTAK
ncbi:hypothetical protein NDU88_001049 [Pleurodeles waltl]|uniref:Uncharacterized protein n=1 Tax=Pleurodeles waltl TaxID=8319 RepID=A0AAV7VYQ3_PLEWA|nr:hypothetical protein NDU88_001049 [Pleurodeles waltl]